MDCNCQKNEPSILFIIKIRKENKRMEIPIRNLFLFVFKNEIKSEGLVGENTFNGIPENPE
jgi:hypothetical protein